MTPLATYSDSALTTPNANPIVADSGGLFGPVYLAFGLSYRMQWKTSTGTLIWDQDNVVGAGFASAVTSTLTGTQNNLVVASGTSFLRLNNASLLSITGIAAGSDGQVLTILSVGGGIVELLDESAGSASTAANRLTNITTNNPTRLAAGKGSAIYQYDGTTQRWRLLSHEQGDWITPAFNAVDYTNWTIAAGDVTRYAYYLRGKQLTVAFVIVTGSVVATPTLIGINLPGGYSLSGTGYESTALANPAGTYAAVKMDVFAGIARFYPTIAGTGNWTTTTNTTNVSATFTVPVV